MTYLTTYICTVPEEAMSKLVGCRHPCDAPVAVGTPADWYSHGSEFDRLALSLSSVCHVSPDVTLGTGHPYLIW